jgi:hypothetical protein
LPGIEPATGNLYQASLSLYRSGMLKDALTVVRQSVALNPNLMKANQLLAELSYCRNKGKRVKSVTYHLANKEVKTNKPKKPDKKRRINC